MSKTAAEHIEAALVYASDVRWDELANGADFGFIDRKMLRELHTRATIALALYQNLSALSSQNPNPGGEE